MFTKTPKAPGKVFLKAALFDVVSPPAAEVFVNKQYQWVIIEQGEKQAWYQGEGRINVLV